MNQLKSDYHCYKCNRQVTVNENQKISFRDCCIGCGVELHVCKNCHFHDPSLNNECAENQAEKVTDKTKSNRCEYFRFKPIGERKTVPPTDFFKKLDDLFK